MKLSHSYIRNPLSVVAVFAAIAQVGGVVTIRFVSEENQAIFVWFLVLFPFLLVILFFGVLIRKPQVFFAPSDYRDDQSFLATLRPASSSEVQAKVEQEIKFSLRDFAENNNAQLPYDRRKLAQNPEVGIQDTFRQELPSLKNENALLLHQDEGSPYYFGERAALDWIIDKNGWHKQNIIGPVVLELSNGTKYVFDFTFFEGETLSFVEVKYFKGEIAPSYVSKIVSDFIKIAEEAMKTQFFDVKRVKIYFLVVSEYYADRDNERKQVMQKILERVQKDLDRRVDVTLIFYPDGKDGDTRTS